MIKELEPDRMRKSGLLVPQGTQDVPPNEGIVLAAGDGPPDLPDFKMPVKPGDHVVFPRSAGVWVEVEDERLLVCRVREILGVIEEEVRVRDVPIRGEMIRLGELLKLAGVVGTGGEAKLLLASDRGARQRGAREPARAALARAMRSSSATRRCAFLEGEGETRGGVKRIRRRRGVASIRLRCHSTSVRSAGAEHST